MKLAEIVLLMALVARESSGCAWTYNTSIDGEVVRSHYSGTGSIRQAMRKGRDKSDWSGKVESLKQRAASGYYQALSDYAVALMHTGKADEAVAILEKLAAERPNEYIIAANLGTAYELTGAVEKSLEWISRSIGINDESHFGTEWLHVKILEAKFAMQKDPDWLKENSVLGLNFGNGKTIAKPASLNDPSQLKTLETALRYQLGERVQFVQPPDAVVADLLFDWGNLMAAFHDLEGAVRLYELSEEYGDARKAEIAPRMHQFRKTIRWAAPKRFLMRHAGKPGVLLIGLAVAVGIVVLAGHRLRARKTGR